MDNRDSRNGRENTFYGDFTEQEISALNEVYGQWIFWKVPRHGKTGYYAWCYEWPNHQRIMDRLFVPFRNHVMKEGENVRMEIESIEDTEETEEEVVVVDEVKEVEPIEPAESDEPTEEEKEVEFEAKLDDMEEEIDFKVRSVPLSWTGEPLPEELDESEQEKKEEAPKFNYDRNASLGENSFRYLTQNPPKRRI